MATYAVRLNNGTTKQIVNKGMTREAAHELAEQYRALIPAENTALKVQVIIEMNAHERVIVRLIQQCVSEWIGGLENTMLDYPKGSEEYERAKATLNHDDLFDAFYSEIMAETKQNYKSHVRFAGKQFIIDRIESRLTKEGYGKQ